MGEFIFSHDYGTIRLVTIWNGCRQPRIFGYFGIGGDDTLYKWVQPGLATRTLKIGHDRIWVVSNGEWMRLNSPNVGLGLTEWVESVYA